MMTPPRYAFTACGSDYPNMSADTKDALHQLVNEAGDWLYQNVELWKRELTEAGWKPHRTGLTVWESPEGALYRGPYGAWKEMKRRSSK